jgi:predicted nuclease of predicted toxin-antitoxin system
MPCTFIVTDFLTVELRDPPFDTLLELGLRVESLNSAEVGEITDISTKYPKPSYQDISVLVLAKSRKTILITGDTDLRHVARVHGVDCYGTCWLIDYLANQNIITFTEAIEAYELIQRKPRYPPKEECRDLLSRWKRSQKLFD